MARINILECVYNNVYRRRTNKPFRRQCGYQVRKCNPLYVIKLSKDFKLIITPEDRPHLSDEERRELISKFYTEKEVNFPTVKEITHDTFNVMCEMPKED